MYKLKPNQRTFLMDFLKTRFNIPELKNVCFELAVSYEEIVGDNINLLDFSRELLLYCERRDLVGNLVEIVLKERHDQVLVEIQTEIGPVEPRIKVQIILYLQAWSRQLEKQLLTTLAGLLNLSQKELSVVSSAPGSVHLLIGMPAHAAQKMSTVDLAKLSRFLPNPPIFFNNLLPAAQQAWYQRYINPGNYRPVTMLPGSVTSRLRLALALGSLMLFGIGLSAGLLIGSSNLPSRSEASSYSPTPYPTYTAYPTNLANATSTAYPTYSPNPTNLPNSTSTPYSTYTPYPTYKPNPTNLPNATNTPYPTYTPNPTNLPSTPYPTYTPYPTLVAKRRLNVNIAWNQSISKEGDLKYSFSEPPGIYIGSPPPVPDPKQVKVILIYYDGSGKRTTDAANSKSVLVVIDDPNYEGAGEAATNPVTFKSPG